MKKNIWRSVSITGRLSRRRAVVLTFIAAVSAAAQTEPKTFGDFFEQGNQFFQQGDYVRAIADYIDAAKLAPEGYGVWGSRGHAYYNLEQYDNVIKDLTEAIRLVPSGKEIHITYNTRGRAYFWGQKNYDKAIADQTQAIALKSDYADAYEYRGRAYFFKGGVCQRLHGHLEPVFTIG